MNSQTNKRAPLGELTNIISPRPCVKKPKLSHSENAAPPPPFNVPAEMDSDDHGSDSNDLVNQRNHSDPELEISASSVDSTSGLVLRKCSGSSFIYDRLRSLEVEDRRRPLGNYMETIQKEVLLSMREVLVDWLVEVSEEFKFCADTIFLSISYIDRYLSSRRIRKDELQLLGISCMLVASKYEEICPRSADEFCYITDNTYTNEEKLKILSRISDYPNFAITQFHSLFFLCLYSCICIFNLQDPGRRFESLSSYLCEVSLLEYKCVRFLPSVIAASCVFLSRFILFPYQQPWTTSLQLKSGYSAADLKDCVLAIHGRGLAITQEGSTLRDGVIAKFKADKHKCIAEMKLPWEIPSEFFTSSQGC
ncbi:Putative cyclin-A3-1 [Linum grandiflorum]